MENYKEKMLKTIGQLQYEISILDIDEERLTGVDIRTEELKDLTNALESEEESNNEMLEALKSVDDLYSEIERMVDGEVKVMLDKVRQAINNCKNK